MVPRDACPAFSPEWGMEAGFIVFAENYKGEDFMAELIHFEFVNLPPCRVIGRELTLSMEEMAKANPVPAFWGKCFEENAFAPLEALGDALYNDALVDAAGAYLDWMGDVEPDGRFRCLVGMLAKPGAEPPEGYAFKDLPAGTLALGQIKGPENEIYSQSESLVMPLIKKAGKKPAGYMMEVYVCPRFTTPDENGCVVLDYYMEVQ